MAEPLPADHPQLQKASVRLQRLQWVWAAVLAGMAVLTWLTLRDSHPLAALPWLAGGLLLAIYLQPALLALTAVLWALSLVSLVPGVAAVFGPDPISQVFSAGPVETIGRAAVRAVLALMAWNQFLLYRMLYGTEGASGLPEDAQPIPEVVANRTDQLAVLSVGLGALGALSALAAVAPVGLSVAAYGAQLAFACSLLGLGLALGATFSPTSSRRLSLVGMLLAVVAFLGALAAGRTLLL